MMEDFLKVQDDLSRLINEKSKELYLKNQNLPLDKIQLPGISDFYFKKNHTARPFLSIQTSAELLYRSIKKSQKKIENIVLMDYGAGIGNLYILAKMIGCKQVIHNDIIKDMALGAEVIAQHLDVSIDLYITADHKGTLKLLNEKGIQCDIILSRNVVEHIYDLKDFFHDMYTYQPQALLYFSTTANYHNPANRWYHRYLHRKFEQKEYGPKRESIIRKKLGDVADIEVKNLLKATRGLAMEDLDLAIDSYLQSKDLPEVQAFETNSCDPETGVWIEQLLPLKKYREIIEPIGYHMEVQPGFWDTHYTQKYKNVLGKTMNWLSAKLGGKRALWTTAFIYIIVYKTKT